MKTPTTVISQGIRQGLDKLVELKELCTMQSTIKNTIGTESILGSLVGNARTIIVTAVAASVLLLGGGQIGTAFAQPVSDPLTIVRSSVLESWSNVSEEAEWPLSAPKVVFATGQTYISEENESLANSPKVVFATLQRYISEENESLANSPKVVFATGQADAWMRISEEFETL
ncbi:MAG: hypothetical protein J4N85_07520 [Chloroflexi bacterium]|nr:hypothetical protein [Chloroflexota bacterium]